jgi:hypothetical protein
MPNRQADLTSAYVDPHGVFSPKSTDPANLGINMCINILDGDNSPRVKDNAIQNVTQHMQTLNIRVRRRRKNSEVDRCLTLVGSILLAIVRRYH